MSNSRRNYFKSRQADHRQKSLRRLWHLRPGLSFTFSRYFNRFPWGYWSHEMKTFHAKSLPPKLATDIAGAFGDIGTFLPLWLALVVICDLNPATSLIFAGLANILTGWIFKIPMAVQPMKAIAAISITAGFSESTVAAAGIIMGIIMLLLGSTQLMNRVSKVVPEPVVRGVQWAVAAKLLFAALKVMANDTQTQVLLGTHYPMIIGALAILTIGLVLNDRTVIISLVLLTLCAVMGYYFWSSDLVPTSSITTQWPPALPTWSSFKQGFLYTVLPQVPMTLLNSVVAVCALGTTLFPQKQQLLNPQKVSFSVGLINLISCPLGGMPMCHGSGGLAGQYAFGARTGFSVIFLGGLKVTIGLACANLFFNFAGFIPKSILGIWLLVACVELIRTTARAVDKETIVTTACLPVITLAADSLITAVVISWGLHKLFLLTKITKQ